MPYTAEHACRVNDPGKYKSFRRQTGKGDQPDMIFGIRADGKSEVQSFRFPVDRFTEAAARAFCREHKGRFEKSVKPQAARLVLKTEPPVCISAEIAGDAGPYRRFRKHLISIGKYVKEDQGLEFTVTDAVMRHWVEAFDAMTANGVTIPMPDAHETAGQAAHNMGYVESLFIDGDKLIANVKLIGRDALDAAARNDVSISVPLDFVDGKGVRYGQAIEHVAFTPEPLIPGLDPFIPLAASRWRVENATMNWETLENALGVEGLNDDTANDLITKAFQAQNKDTATLQASLNANEAKLKSTETTLAEVQAKVQAEPEKLGPVTLDMARKTQATQLDMLVQASKITPAVRDGLHALFIGDNGDRIQASAANGTHRLFDDVISLFEKNDPVALGEKTGPQTYMKLSREEASADSLLNRAKARSTAAVAG